jgi:hypothetical protein
MEPHALTPTYELFFILESFQACFAEYVTALRPLDGRLGSGLLGCDVYYREDTDVALLALRFDERELDAERLSWILDFAGGAGLAALDPTMLPDEDRRRFYKTYLDEYPLRSEDAREPRAALQALAQTLGLRVPRVLTANVVHAPAPTPAPGGRMRTEATKTWKPTGRGRKHDPPLRAVPDELADQPTAPTAARQADADRADGEAARRFPRASSPPAIARIGLTDAGADAGGAAATDDGRTYSARGRRVRLGSDRDGQPGSGHGVLTGTASPHETSASDAAGGDRPPRGRRITRRPPGVSRGDQGADDEPPQISVRFRRGDDWVPARLRSLGLKGAYLACGAPPRLHDDVHVALGLGPLGTVMRGTVVHVTSAEDANASGASGFGVLFPPVESPARRQLKELLQAARQRGIVLEPPPPRKSVRFPVRWPVQIVLPNQQGLDLAALDISFRGMFLSTLDRLPAGALEFFMPTEQAGAPIHGRVRAVREVPWKVACARGLHSGFGMEIVDFTRADDGRFGEFVDRVGRRVLRRVLVGASPDRAEELVTGLTASGYTVSGSSDANAIIKIGECDPRPPDLALIDASLVMAPDVQRRLQQVFEQRQVPLVGLQGDPAYRARAVIDSVLHVTGEM